MPTQLQVTTYLLPADEAPARSALLSVLQAAEEVWVLGDSHALADVLPVLANRGGLPPAHVLIDDLGGADDVLLGLLVDRHRTDITLSRETALPLQGATAAGGLTFLSAGPIALLVSHIDLALHLRLTYTELGRAAWEHERGVQRMAEPPPDLAPLPSVDESVTLLTTDEHGHLVPKPTETAAPTAPPQPPPAPQSPSDPSSATPPHPTEPAEAGVPTGPETTSAEPAPAP